MPTHRTRLSSWFGQCVCERLHAQVLHWDGLFHRRACAAHTGASDARDQLAPSAVPFCRPALVYDGKTLRSNTLEVRAYTRTHVQAHASACA